ncbi:MAG: CHASE3 domain-containing protein [Pirellulaceae bacterium]|nr:CHASE3 domain-containing protein [Pirellulaceae bacterium]
MAAVIFVLVVSGVVALRNFRDLQENRLKVQYTSRVLAALREVEAAVMDAESRQRGFLITANESYIEPFNEAVRRANASLRSMSSITRNDPIQQQSLDELRTLIDERIDELKHVLTVRVSQGVEAAQLELEADAEKRTMERIHSKTNAMRQIENDVLTAREKAAAHSYRSGQTNSILSTAIGLILVGGVLYLLERNRRKAEHAALALRVTRERLQLALDAAELGSWNINPANQHLIGDQQFCKIFGFSEDECTYQRAVEALHPDDRVAVETAIAESTRMKDPAPYCIEYRVVHSDGTVLWVLAQGAANFTGKGNQRKLSSFNGTVVDITERKRQEQRLLESEQAALAASRSKSEFLANMSHEIRTPMAAILGYADVLLGHLKDPDNRNCVQVIQRNGQHLLELINDILDLSRIEAGKLEVEMESVSLPQLVADLQSLMQVRADAKKLDFRAVFTSKVPQTIATDPTRLRQVLINLIGNAIKFTERGSIVLSIGYSPSGVLTFSVCDTGIGMSDEQQQRLFKPFSQGDSSVTRSYGGSGLGLAISLRLAGMLGGDISMSSRLGEGSTFTVTLPIETDNTVPLVQPDLIAPAREHEPMESATRPLACRVLVVDDRRDVRHISQHFLEKAGAKVVTAEDGRFAIDVALAAHAAGQPFDLVVMDMQMPNLDGLQATAQLRSEGIQWPIIALTADAMKGDRQRCLDGGCDDYLSKPIDHDKLVGMAARYTQDITQQELQKQRDERAAERQRRLGKTP